MLHPVGLIAAVLLAAAPAAFAQCIMPALGEGVVNSAADPCPDVGDPLLNSATCTVNCAVGTRT